MGEKEEKKKKGGEAGAEKKKEGGGGGGGGKKEAAAGPTPVVLKVDMHCEGCAMKIKRAVKGLPGVEAVSTDMANNKLTVVGNVDPLKIRERLESKTHKKVDLLTPVPKADPEPNKKAKPDQEQQKKPESKPKTAVSSTVAMKIRLHCDGCIQRIRKTILKYKGVESVTIDSQKDLVTVTGTMDAGSLVPYLKDKLKRSVDVVAPAKKDDGGAGGGEKKEKGGNAGGEKKEKGGGGGGGDGEKKEKGKGDGGDGEKKEKGKGDGGGGDKKKEGGDGEKKKEKEGGGGGEKKEKGKGDGGGGDKKKEGGDGEKKKEKEGGGGGGGEKKEAVAATTMEANKMEYYGTYGYGNGNGYGNGYHMEMVHAPQMFSDENPNACSIM